MKISRITKTLLSNDFCTLERYMGKKRSNIKTSYHNLINEFLLKKLLNKRKRVMSIPPDGKRTR